MRRLAHLAVGLSLLCAPLGALAQTAYYPLILNGAQPQQLPSTSPLLTRAPTTSNSSLRLPHGTAPSSPVNGDVWTTTAGLFARINGSTIGPFNTGAGNVSTSGGITTNGMSYWASATGLASTAAPTNGQVLIGSSGAPPALATLTAGSGVTITNAAGSITIAASSSGGATDSFARAVLIMANFGGL